ncbi:MAG: hypothetical protein CMJ76_02185 [Planctomycetaceae bacterium]|nr:hypothetical protein [Planctomycetaceae bacterium]|tara:strand:+ start:2210 stop:2992 length:783 start_codon:yes stop_codon:yes gene_type:complete
MDRPVRIGAVSYLNTKPLVYGLAQRLPDTEIVFDLPSRLADDLANGELDVALIPTVEYFQDPDYRIVSDACIACRGEVYSVSLLSRCNSADIKTLALDEGSRTSAALVQILLRKRLGIVPELHPFPIGSDLTQLDTDAMLIIGDRAMHVDKSDFQETWDLGQAWVDWTGLPFVFAMWTARADLDFDLTPIESAMSAARDEGVRNLAKIAARHAAELGISQQQCEVYLRDNLYFYLGKQEQQGQELFREFVDELSAVSQNG